MVEVKTAAKSYTVTRDYIAQLHREAIRTGKDDAMIVLQFPGYEVVMDVRRTQLPST